MEDQARSIDFAKTASIDMMTLNNKVVSMRAVVKRTKVQVINKLCRHINILKKKKGTEEHRAKNLRKAERLIEEIDSLKRLKEDKVTKYALANTSTFKEVSKMSTAGGVRALARLADHPVMMKAVNDFRSKHSDWRDLAAYLLVKQTGRRFKTKKQKEKKKAFRMENIDASETMTKAYIQERFGKDGVITAERKFNRRRQKGQEEIMDEEDDGPVKDMKEGLESKTAVKEPVNTDKSNSDKEKQEMEKSKVDRTKLDVKKKENLKGDVIEESISERKSQQKVSNTDDVGEKQGKTSFEKVRESGEKRVKISNSLKEEEDDDDDDDDDDDKVHIESEDENDSESQSNDSEDSSRSAAEEGDTSSESDSEEIHQAESKKQKVSSTTDKLQEKIARMMGKNKDDQKEKDECVVKEFNIETEDVVGGSEDAESDSESESSNFLISAKKKRKIERLNEEDQFGSSEESVDEESGNKEENKNSMEKLRKDSKIPDILTQSDSHSTANFTSDLFLVGSDDDDGDEEEDLDSKNYEQEPSDDENAFESQDSHHGRFSRITHTDSLFLNSLGEQEERSRWKGNKRGFERRGRGRGGFRERGGKFAAYSRGEREFSGSRGQVFGKSGRGARDRGGRGRHLLDKGPGGRGERGGGGYNRGMSRDKQQSNRWEKSTPASTYRFNDKDASGEKSNSRQAAAPTSQSSEKLHPSWEASRKRKAEQSSGLSAFKGSKIMFDDD